MSRTHFLALRLLKAVSFCLVMLHVSFVCSAQQPSAYPQMTNAAADDMARTYGFYMGQVLAIQEMSMKFPEFAPELTRAQARFNMAFKASVENIDAILAKEISYWVSERPARLEKMKSLVVANVISIEQVRTAAKEFAARADGNIPSPFLETLLMYHPTFLRNPAEEFIQGYTRSFQSAGHPKSKGINFKISHPTSWKAKDGEHPNIIVKFVSENGRGLGESVLIVVEELPVPERQRITEADIQDLFSEDTVKVLLGNGAKLISSTRIKIEGLPGVMVHYVTEGQRLDVIMQTRNLRFITLFKNKLINVDCGVTTTKDKAQTLDARFRRLEPLFKLMANSLIVQDRWPR